MFARAGRKKPDMVRILHAADFHLDSAYGALTAEQAVQRRRESRENLTRLVDYANDHQAELMLLSGDLFDSEAVFAQTGELLAAELERFAGEVVIAPGNHDYYSERSAYARIMWPKNVHIFRHTAMESVSFPQYGCVVHGAAFVGEAAEELPLAHIAPSDGWLHLGVLHGETGSKDSRYRPISVQQIAESGLAYLALGHVHGCSGVQQAGNTAYAYPGCLEGRGFDELGDKGFLFGEVDSESVRLHFVPFAKRRYQILRVDVTDSERPIEAISRRLPLRTEDDIYRILLTGECAEPVRTEKIQAELADRFYHLEVRDQTRLQQDLWARSDDDTLRGLFLRQMRAKYDTAEDEEQRHRIEQAVRFGLDAMDNRE